MDKGQVVIRMYVDSDHAAVVDLWSVVFPDDPPWNEPVGYVRRKKAVQPDLFLVAQSDDQIVGTVVAGYDGVRGWIYHLAVDPSNRRQGTGRLLMSAAEGRLEALGCAKINLQIKAGNASVIDFYRSLGYKTEERIQMGKPLGKYGDQQPI